MTHTFMQDVITLGGILLALVIAVLLYIFIRIIIIENFTIDEEDESEL